MQMATSTIAKKPLAPFPSSSTEKLADQLATSPMKAAGIRMMKISKPVTPGKIG
jgi:hypothetical protein